jgi:hypothetical protein
MNDLLGQVAEGTQAAFGQLYDQRAGRVPGLVRRLLTELQGQAVTLAWSLHLKKSAIIGKGLKLLRGGKTYELWCMGAA